MTRKYLMGEIDCWLRHKPDERIGNCWPKSEDKTSVYDIHSIFVFEDDELIKVLPGALFVIAWMDHCKVFVDFDRDISSQFYDFVGSYVESKLK